MGRDLTLRPGTTGPWISALDAVHHVSDRVGNDDLAKEQITTRLLDGALSSCAFWLASAYDHPMLYSGGHPESKKLAVLNRGNPPDEADAFDALLKSQEPLVVPNQMGPDLAFQIQRAPLNIVPAVWKNAGKQETDRWDWSSGFFVFETLGTLQSHPTATQTFIQPVRFVCYTRGLHFDEQEVQRIGKRITSVGSDKKISNAGRPPHSELNRWIGELLFVCHEEGIDNSKSSRLALKVQENLDKQGIAGPGETSSRGRLREILAYFEQRRRENP